MASVALSPVRLNRLGHNELRGYLILFDPHAQTHDRQSDASQQPSQQFVQTGSGHITAHPFVQLASNQSHCVEDLRYQHVGWLTLGVPDLSETSYQVP